MANIGTSAIKLIDSDGDALDDGAGKLNVNATLVGDLDLDIGDVEILGHGAVTHAAVNVTDSAVQLTAGACKHLDIMANLSNTGIVYIGAAAVSATTGIALYPGDVYSVDVANMNLLYVISTVSGDDINVVTYI